MLACNAELEPDAALAAALSEDLERSFEALVIAYRTRIVSFVARTLRDDARAEDVAQDVFVRAYRALQGYDVQRIRDLRLRAWLYAIAHNLTRNALRDAPPRGEPLERDDGSSHAAAVDRRAGPDELAARRETFDAIGRAVQQLSPRLRPAFVMRYFEELAYDDIARVLQQPLGTVRASAHRALRAVRATLEHEHD